MGAITPQEAIDKGFVGGGELDLEAENHAALKQATAEAISTATLAHQSWRESRSESEQRVLAETPYTHVPPAEEDKGYDATSTAVELHQGDAPTRDLPPAEELARLREENARLRAGSSGSGGMFG